MVALIDGAYAPLHPFRISSSQPRSNNALTAAATSPAPPRLPSSRIWRLPEQGPLQREAGLGPAINHRPAASHRGRAGFGWGGAGKPGPGGSVVSHRSGLWRRFKLVATHLAGDGGTFACNWRSPRPKP